ncbi:MAG TPA: universal stress protein, partial [Gemmatimonadales bacterium]|nr:universal stress protein [Gemmatimonadales bacterium]
MDGPVQGVRAWSPVRFGHLLVALDGSRLAETVLPVVAAFAARFAARATVVHVVEPGGPATVHGDRHLREAGEAERYLAEVAGWLGSRGVAAG